MSNERGAIASTLVLLAESDIEVLIAGGVAAQMYGSQRVTMDIDLIPSFRGVHWRALLAFFKENAIEPIGPQWVQIETVSRLRKWSHANDVFGLRFERKDPHIVIDLLIAEAPMYEQYKARAQVAVDGDAALRFVSKADLITMKTIAGRPQDLLDITAMSGD